VGTPVGILRNPGGGASSPRTSQNNAPNPAAYSDDCGSNLLRYLRYKEYISQNFNVVFPYVLADTVRKGYYWYVLYAEGLSLNATDTTRPNLFMIPPGVTLPGNTKSSGTGGPFGGDAFFQGPNGENDPPASAAIRLSPYSDSVGQNALATGQGNAMIPNRGVFVPEGWTLMLWDSESGGGSNGNFKQISLRIAYIEIPFGVDPPNFG
jgi:hypothetical protein